MCEQEYDRSRGMCVCAGGVCVCDLIVGDSVTACTRFLAQGGSFVFERL